MTLRRFGWLLLAPLLGACGLIPLPVQTAPDLTITNSAVRLVPAQVAYMSVSLLDGLKVPALPYRNVTLDAKVQARDGERLRLEVFAASVKPDCPFFPAAQPEWFGALVCDGPGPGQPVAEFVLESGLPTQVHMQGAVLDRAMKAATLHLGLRLLSGDPEPYSLLDVTEIRLHASL